MSVVSVHPLWPGNGGNARIHALNRALVELGHEVRCIYPHGPLDGEGDEHDAGVAYTPIPAAPLGQRDWPRWVRRTKRMLAPLPSQVGARSGAFADALRTGAPPDVVVLPGAYGRSLIRAVPRARIWIDFHDAMSRYAAHEVRYLDGLGRWSARVQSRSMQRGERRTLRRASTATAAGRADADFLTHLGRRPVVWLPTPVEVPGPIPRPSASQRIGLLGSFSYAPNRDAARVLADRWLGPLGAAGWQVVVAGRDSGALRLPMAIRRMGEVEDVRSFYQSVDAVVVPVRRGGGMKVKVIEALGHGRPVIGTAFAFEGFDELPAVTVVDERDPVIPMHLEPPTEDEVAQLAREFGPAAFATGVGRLLEALGC